MAAQCNESADRSILERKIILDEWPGPWAGWAKNYCSRNLWRISNVVGNDIDDAMSECALVYVECSRRYGHTVVSQAQMMTLYKLSVTCWFNTLSRKDFKNREYLAKLSDREPEVKSDAELVVALDEASSELKEVINILCNAPQEIMEVLRADATSYSPRQFFRTVLKHCKIPEEQASVVQHELIELLS